VQQCWCEINTKRVQVLSHRHIPSALSPHTQFPEDILTWRKKKIPFKRFLEIRFNARNFSSEPCPQEPYRDLKHPVVIWQWETSTSHDINNLFLVLITSALIYRCQGRKEKKPGRKLPFLLRWSILTLSLIENHLKVRLLQDAPSILSCVSVLKDFCINPFSARTRQSRVQNDVAKMRIPGYDEFPTSSNIHELYRHLC
jgi:hypothetical protein